jgi:Cytochrome C oxidase, cbb3-type, subunit III
LRWSRRGLGQRSPLLCEEGWLRHQENAGEAHLNAADGVVAHRNMVCERPPRPLLQRLLRVIFLVSRPPLLTRRGLLLLLVVVLLLQACRQQMADQGRYKPLEESNFFPDHRSARQLPVGVVARGFLDENEHLYAGRVNGQLATTFPFQITADVLARGQDRYNIFCTPCHDRVGSGNGMAVRRGFRRPPPTFHMDRLREAPVGHFFDVISNGFGAMNDYAAQIKPADRWAIVAYVRALQFSQDANVQSLPPEDRRELERLPQ